MLASSADAWRSRALAELRAHHALQREHQASQFVVQPLEHHALLPDVDDERAGDQHHHDHAAVPRGQPGADRPLHVEGAPRACSLRRGGSGSGTAGQARSIFRRSRCTQTSTAFESGSCDASQTCSVSAARPTTAFACRTRYSSSEYSRAVNSRSRPLRRTRRARVSSDKRADREHRRRDRTMAPAEQRPQPRQQFAEVERLGQVVVRAAVEAADPRFDGIARRQHQDRDLQSRLAQLAADGEAVLPRKADIENDRVELRNGGL